MEIKKLEQMKKFCKKCITPLPKYEYTGFCANCYILEKTPKPKTLDEARQYAIDWQNWQSEQDLSYSELIEWQAVFTELADKYSLQEEFEENGII